MQVVGLNMGVTGRVVKERDMIVGLEWAMSKVVVAAINDGTTKGTISSFTRQ
jgi:hypothetical protein